ncbi:MAG: VWA domain-containing protein [Candidatus Desulfofervidus auxilii]|nr:VWA domain-containing protein [Candidatus Desulfofervidus auxilii]
MNHKLKRFIDLMEVISTALGEDIDLRIRPGQGWSYDYEKNEVVFPEKLLLNYTPEEVIGFTIHEAGHRQITRIDMRREEFKLFYSKPYLTLLLSVFEDARVNNWMFSLFPGVRYYLEFMYKDLISESLEKSEYVRHLQRQINGTVHPYQLYPHLEYVLSVMYYWRYKKIPELLINPEVKKTLKNTIPYFAEIFNCYPEGRGGEKERFEFSYKAAQLIKEYVLEEYERLVHLSKERVDQAFQNREIKNHSGHGGSGSGLSAIEQSAKELAERLSPKIDRPDKKQADKYTQINAQSRQRTKPTSALTLKDLIREQRRIKRKESFSVYHKFYNEIADVIQYLCGVLENYFFKNTRLRYQGYFKSGQKPDLRKAMNQFRKIQQKIPLEEKDLEIFMRRRLPTVRTHSIALVLDESGSMVEPKRSAALKGLLLFMESLTNLDIDYAIIGFSDTVIVHKMFGEVMNQSQRADLFEEISMYIPSGMTADADALVLTTELLEKEPKEAIKLIIMITDGEGNINNTGKTFAELQEEAVVRDIEVVGVGLGGYVTQVNKRYKTPVQVEEIIDLPRILSKVLEEKIIYDEYS